MKVLITTIFTCLYLSSFSQIQSVYTNFKENFDEYDLIYSGKLNNKFLFIRATGNSLPELLVTNPTTKTTQFLDHADYLKAVIFKNELYYLKRNNQSGYQIWRTDGTNTTIFLDSVSYRQKLFATEEVLLFMKNDQIWRTDGTITNTAPISEATYSIQETPRGFHAFLDKIYFETRTGKWLIEGNTLKPFDLVPDETDLYFNGVEFNGFYYMAGKENAHGCELWRTDGTPQGTTLFKDLDPANTSSHNNELNSGSPNGFQIIDGKMFFGSDQGIWTSDGTSNGTVLIKPIENVNHNYSYGWTNILFGRTPIHGTLNGKYFIAIENTEYGNEIWVSDGTETGTYVLNIFEGSGYGLSREKPKPMAILDNQLYFAADNGQLGQELWRTDGTIEGTTIIKDINAGVRGTELLSLESIDDQLLFISQTSDHKNTTLYSFDKNANPETPSINNVGIEWHKVIGQADLYVFFNIHNKDLELDNNGNVFVLGNSDADIPLALFNDNYVLPSDAQNYVEKDFIIKYNNLGELQWVNYTYGNRFRNFSMAIDANDEIIIGGNIPTSSWLPSSSSIPFFGSNISITEQSAYITKLNKNGEKEWSKFLGGEEEEILDITTDNENNIYVLSRKKLLKYNENGQLIWTKELNEISYQRTGAIKIFNQFLYIPIGTCNGDCRETGILQVNKYTLDGSPVWEKKFYGTGTVEVNDFEISPEGQLAIIGDYSRQLIIPPYKKIISSEINENKKSIFHVRMDRNGHVIRVINDTISNISQNIVFNDKQQYYTVSENRNNPSEKYNGFEDYRDFPSSYNTLSVKKYDYFHTLIEERTFYANRPFMNIKMKITPDDKILLSGLFNERLDTLPFHIKDREDNIQLIKFGLNDAPNPAPTWEKLANLSLSLSPNPTRGIVTVRVIEAAFSNYDLSIFNAKGQMVGYFEKRNDDEYATYYLNHYESGVYFFKFKNGEEEVTKKMILLNE